MREGKSMRNRRDRWLRTLALAAGIVASAALIVPAAPASAATPEAGTVTVGGKCLDDADFGTADGNVIQIFDCNGSSAQKWSWETDGTVRVFGKCLDITGASNATGARAQLHTCVPEATNQKFRALPDGTIYSADSAKCLAVLGTIAKLARVGLASCDPAKAQQRWTAATAPAPRYTLSGGTAHQNTYGSDTPTLPHIDKDGMFWVQNAAALYGATESRSWKFYTGADFDSLSPSAVNTAVNPSNASDRNDDTTWRCNNSPTGLTSSYAPAGSSYSQRNYCDLTGIWVDPDTGDWYGLVHNEFTPQPFGDGMHYDSVDYAISRDQGRTWKITAQVITSPYGTQRGDANAFPGAIYNYGGADPRLFVDNASGYFYVFYSSRTIAKPGTAAGQSWLSHVARAPISQKMAPSSWRKWHDGAWQSPGVGGEESNIIPADGGGLGYTSPDEDYDPSELGSQPSQVAAGTLPDDSQLAVLNVSWSAYLGMYIGTPQNSVAQDTGTKTPMHFYGTKDLATQKWTDLGLVDSNPNGSWYRWLVDSGNRTSSNILGKTFRSYCTFECSTYWNEWSDTTIEPVSTADLPQPPVTAGSSYRISTGAGDVLVQSGAYPGAAASAPGTSAEKWRFTSTGDGYFRITNAGSGQAVSAYATTNGARAWGAGLSLVPVASSGAALVNQQWSLQEIVSSPSPSGASAPTGRYRLVNRFSGLALSLSPTAAKQAAMSPVRQWQPSGPAAADPRPASAQELTFSLAP